MDYLGYVSFYVLITRIKSNQHTKLKTQMTCCYFTNVTKSQNVSVKYGYY